MDHEVETYRLRRDLKHYSAELSTITDPRDVKVLTELIFAIATRLSDLDDKQRSHLWALSETDVWGIARRLIHRHGVNAPEVASQHADALSKANHSDGAAAWRRILHAAEELLRALNVGERMN
jgi:hypothetical protein